MKVLGIRYEVDKLLKIKFHEKVDTLVFEICK